MTWATYVQAIMKYGDESDKKISYPTANNPWCSCFRYYPFFAFFY